MQTSEQVSKQASNHKLLERRLQWHYYDDDDTASATIGVHLSIGRVIVHFLRRLSLAAAAAAASSRRR